MKRRARSLRLPCHWVERSVADRWLVCGQVEGGTNRWHGEIGGRSSASCIIRASGAKIKFTWTSSAQENQIMGETFGEGGSCPAPPVE